MIPLSFVTHADSEDAIDYTKDHTRAMKMLEDAGIHVLFVSPLASIARDHIQRPSKLSPN